jgi:hypothetical protein
MAASRRRTQFAAPFIVVLGCGGAQRTPPDPPDVPGETWRVYGAAGECEADPPMGHCPKGALCNPPPPRPIECPEGYTEGTTLRIVKRPDATCGIIPSGCTELACVAQTTACPLDYGAPRKLVGQAWQVTKSDDGACFARVPACAATETACAQAIECPATVPAYVVQRRGQCVIATEGCADTSCVSTATACPMPVGKDLGALKWLGRREGTDCFVKSTGPIAGEVEQKIACPNDPKSSLKFQIDRATRADECVYRAGTAPPVTTPCPP